MKKIFKEKEIELPKSDDALLDNLSQKRDSIDNREGAEAEEKLLADLGGKRDFNNKQWQYWIIALVAFCWSSYHIFVAIWPVNGVYVRSVHLAFAFLLAFLIYPMRKTTKQKINFQWYDYILAIIAVCGALYGYIDYQGLSDRAGAYITRDVVFAILTVVLLLEASRRSLGMALSVIASIFLLYDYFGQYMPEVIAYKGASIAKLSGHLYLTTEGIFGTPLSVSADYVFLFVLFGALLERAGAGEYFINLAYSLLGKYRGGPAKASVAASGLTGIISGSSIANTVTTGTFTIPLMKKIGFPKHKAAAVEVAASTNGQLMPPIMGAAAFIIAETLGISYTDVVMAAFIPAFVSYFALFYIVHLESLKLGLKGEKRENLPPRWKTFIAGIHYIIPIFFLVYTLIVLRQSAGAAAINAIMFIMIIMAVQKPIYALMKKRKVTLDLIIEGFSDIGHGMINGAKNMIPIAIATALAGIVVGSITLTGVGLVLIDLIEQLSQGYIILILLFVAIVSLILGMGLPTTANYIVVSSLTAQVILVLAFDAGYIVPSIAAHLFVFYFGILADDTPPVGLAAYAASGIAKSDPIKTGIQGFTYDMRTAILPFMFFFNSELLLIKDIDPYDNTKWTWITNPFDIGVIFLTAIIGMFSFSSATQGYFVAKANILERILFFVIVPFMFLPKVFENHLGFPNHYVSYGIGIGLFILIYVMQKSRIKAGKATVF